MSITRLAKRLSRIELRQRLVQVRWERKRVELKVEFFDVENCPSLVGIIKIHAQFRCNTSEKSDNWFSAALTKSIRRAKIYSQMGWRWRFASSEFFSMVEGLRYACIGWGWRTKVTNGKLRRFFRNSGSRRGNNVNLSVAEKIPNWNLLLVA